MKNLDKTIYLIVACIAGIVGILLAKKLFACCAEQEGPAIRDASEALDKGEVTSILKWVKPDRKTEITVAFNSALKNRKEKPLEKNNIDNEFFTILARINKEGRVAKNGDEGSPFWGSHGEK